MANDYRKQHYVDGNTVRKVNYEPQRKTNYRPKPTSTEKKKNSRNISKNVEREKAFSLGYMVVLVGMVACVLFFCVNYLRVQAQITSQKKAIASSQEELSSLKDENKIAQDRIDSSVDLNDIYKTATEELGMVYADSSKVIYYDKVNPDYLKQYEDIPSTK